MGRLLKALIACEERGPAQALDVFDALCVSHKMSFQPLGELCLIGCSLWVVLPVRLEQLRRRQVQGLRRLGPCPLLARVRRAGPKELAPRLRLAELLHDKCLLQILHLVAVPPGTDHHGDPSPAAPG